MKIVIVTCCTCAMMALGMLPQAVYGITPVILSNDQGFQAHILPIGATIQRLIVPNHDGLAEDVVLGFDDPKEYQVQFCQANP